MLLFQLLVRTLRKQRPLFLFFYFIIYWSFTLAAFIKFLCYVFKYLSKCIFSLMDARRNLFFTIRKTKLKNTNVNYIFLQGKRKTPQVIIPLFWWKKEKEKNASLSSVTRINFFRRFNFITEGKFQNWWYYKFFSYFLLPTQFIRMTLSFPWN